MAVGQFVLSVKHISSKQYQVPLKKNKPKERERMNVKKMANVGVLTALSVLLMVLIKFPIFPSTPFLLYDPGDVAILIISFLYGPIPALTATLISSILMALLTGQGGPYGVLMHFLATGALVATAGIIYKKHHNKKGAIIGLLSGSLAMTLIMVPANLLVTPLYTGAPVDYIIGILPFIILFNIIKSLVNSGITLLVYKRLANFLREKGLIRVNNSLNTNS
jgi:riboflavin transporter FmnP